MFGFLKSQEVPDRHHALPGRAEAMEVTNRHYVNGRPIVPPFPQDCREVVLGLGCFWGAERVFWETPGVYTTAVGYAGGITPNPTYREVCSGQTGHTEVVRVVYEPATISLDSVLSVFWQAHNPTQGMRQGNDVGTQYRSAVFAVSEADLDVAKASMHMYQQALNAAGYPTITTELDQGQTFYYAEDYHQQYLAKNPGGYCGLGGTGVSCPSIANE